jgi:hypothetical protein
MAIKYLSHLETLNIDMQGYELQNAVVHNVTATSKPASPGVGQIIYNSTDEALEVWDGSAWVSAAGDITGVVAGTGLVGGGTSGSVTVNVDYAGADNFILAAGAGTGDVSSSMHIAVSDASSNVDYFPVSALPFTDNVGTVTSVTITGSDGIDVDSGSPITASGTIALGLSNIPNTSLANDSVTVTAGDGLTTGGAVALGGSVTVDVDYEEGDNVVLAGGAGALTVTPEFDVLLSSFVEGDEKKATEARSYPLSALPFNNFTGVTSVEVTGNDGISVSGSPITTSGTITLGIDALSIENGKLKNSSVTYGSTTVALGGTSTSIAGLTGLDFTAADASIAASIGAKILTIGGGTTTVSIPGNLTVAGTLLTKDANEVNIGDAIIKLNAEEVGAPTENAGIEIQRGTSSNVFLLWDETADRWDFGAAYDVRANAFIGDLEGNADTASSAAKWTTARTITLSGDASGSVEIDGSADVTLDVTTTASGVAPNSVALGTDTTGDYVATLSTSGALNGSGSGEGSAVSLTVDTTSVDQLGVVELATSAEAIAGTDTERAVTPKAASDLVADRQASKRFVKQYTPEDIGKNGVIVTHDLDCEHIIVQVWMITEGESAKEFTIGEITQKATKEVVHTEITQIDKLNAAIHVDMVPAGILEVCIIAVC